MKVGAEMTSNSQNCKRSQLMMNFLAGGASSHRKPIQDLGNNGAAD